MQGEEIKNALKIEFIKAFEANAIIVMQDKSWSIVSDFLFLLNLLKIGRGVASKESDAKYHVSKIQLIGSKLCIASQR